MHLSHSGVTPAVTVRRQSEATRLKCLMPLFRKALGVRRAIEVGVFTGYSSTAVALVNCSCASWDRGVCKSTA